ncbi:PilN domain-containing protein [Candidatus Halobeggiatoa sp. HSG11]|nr:PilN domain-containing protein [Candidatus Halobeggiatoa sp. HSG11]
MPPNINLLPWRDTLKKEREVRFGIIIGVSLLLTGLVVLIIHLYFQGEINYQQSRNNYLKKQIKIAEAKIEEIKTLDEKKKRLIERMNIIQELEENRPQIVHLFDELVKQVPNGVYFTNMIQKNNKITLEGVAQSDARVSSLMGKIKESKWLSNPEIKFIKAEGETKSNFKLVVTQSVPPLKSE